MQWRNSGSQPGRITPGLMLALGILSMSASFSTDLYLPSFPELAGVFGAGSSIVQLTLTSFMLGLAIGQLFVGSLSDALGRRPTLILGLTLFALSSFATVLSPSIEVLIALRALQGFGAASGAVLTRSIIADIASPHETARAFSLLFIMIGIGPIIASPVGALLTELGGWRAPLAGLGVLAALMLVMSVFAVPESLPPARRQPFRFGSLARNLWRLLKTSTFVGYTVAFGSGYTAMMVYISSSSFIAQDFFGLSSTTYSLTFASTALCFTFGALAGRKLVTRFGGHSMLRIAQLVQLTTALLLVMLSVFGLFTLPAYLLLAAGLSVASGTLMPTASALAIAQATGVAGAGSALIGFSQFLFGAIGSPLGGILGTTTVIPTAVAIMAFALISIAGASVAKRGHTVIP